MHFSGGGGIVFTVVELHCFRWSNYLNTKVLMVNIKQNFPEMTTVPYPLIALLFSPGFCSDPILLRPSKCVAIAHPRTYLQWRICARWFCFEPRKFGAIWYRLNSKLDSARLRFPSVHFIPQNSCATCIFTSFLFRHTRIGSEGPHNEPCRLVRVNLATIQNYLAPNSFQGFPVQALTEKDHK